MVLVIGTLDFGICLEFVIWNLEFIVIKPVLIHPCWVRDLG